MRGGGKDSKWGTGDIEAPGGLSLRLRLSWRGLRGDGGPGGQGGVLVQCFPNDLA